MAIWSLSAAGLETVRASRYLLTTGTWSPAVILSVPAADADAGDLETDALGNAFAVWHHQAIDDGQVVAQAARYTFATGTWSAPQDLAVMGDDGEDVHLALGRAGSAVIGWEFDDEPTDVEKVQWTEWLATPNAPTITSISSGNGTLLVAFTPPPTSEDAFAPTYYEYFVDNVSGVGWIGGTPPFTTSPITVRSLTNGVTYTVRIRAWNAAGAGVPSGEGIGTAGEGLLSPTNLRLASINANTVTLAWTYNAGSVAPLGFELEGGLRPGEVLATIPTGDTATSFTFTAPTGAFYIRVRAVRGATRSGASNEIRIFVNVPPPPEAPQNLEGSALGSTLQLAWQRPGGSIDAYILDVTGTLSTSVILPGTSELFTYAGVPAGTFTFTLRAQNATGVSESSNPVTLVFPGVCPRPNAPTGLFANVVGRTVTLFWNVPAGGGSPASYEIEAGVFPFQTAVVASVGSATRTFSATAPPGTYYVRVRSVYACGPSALTDAITVNVPFNVP